MMRLKQNSMYNLRIIPAKCGENYTFEVVHNQDCAILISSIVFSEVFFLDSYIYKLVLSKIRRN